MYHHQPNRIKVAIYSLLGVITVTIISFAGFIVNDTRPYTYTSSASESGDYTDVAIHKASTSPIRITTDIPSCVSSLTYIPEKDEQICYAEITCVGNVDRTFITNPSDSRLTCTVIENSSNTIIQDATCGYNSFNNQCISLQQWKKYSATMCGC